MVRIYQGTVWAGRRGSGKQLVKNQSLYFLGVECVRSEPFESSDPFERLTWDEHPVVILHQSASISILQCPNKARKLKVEQPYQSIAEAYLSTIIIGQVSELLIMLLQQLIANIDNLSNSKPLATGKLGACCAATATLQ
jgi:hypothetical protein